LQVPRDDLIGDVFEVVADGLWSRTGSQDLAAGTPVSAASRSGDCAKRELRKQPG
jgi:hypothetical protein